MILSCLWKLEGLFSTVLFRGIKEKRWVGLRVGDGEEQQLKQDNIVPYGNGVL